MNLVSLQYFIAVCEYMNYTKAAEHLYVSQPTLSRHINMLEEELGVQLIDRRIKNRIVLTEYGEICYTNAKKILEYCDALTEQIEYNKNKIIGTVRLGFYGVSPYENKLMTGLTQHMKSQYADITVKFVQRTLANLTIDLLNDSLDVILTLRAELEDLKNLSIQKLTRGWLCAVFSKTHPLAGRASLYPHELRGEKLLIVDSSLSPKLNNKMVQFCVQNGLPMDHLSQELNFQTKMYRVACGNEVAIGASIPNSEMYPAVVSVPLKGFREEFADYVVAHKKKNINPAIQHLLDSIHTVVRDSLFVY